MRLVKSAGSGDFAGRMVMFRRFLADKRVRAGLALSILVALVAGWVAWKAGVTPAKVIGIWKLVESFLEHHPAYLFWAIVFLPGLPLPTSALLLMAGVVWRDRPILACSLCLLAMAMNLSWTYWVAAGPARGIVEKLLKSGTFSIPDLPRGDHLKLILLMRLTPGVPFFVQNYLLGFMRAPFLLYLPVSLLCSGIIGTGVVLSGTGLGGGNLGWAISGISLLVAGAILIHFVRGWLARRKERVAGEGGGTGFSGSN